MTRGEGWRDEVQLMFQELKELLDPTLPVRPRLLKRANTPVEYDEVAHTGAPFTEGGMAFEDHLEEV